MQTAVARPSPVRHRTTATFAAHGPAVAARRLPEAPLTLQTQQSGHEQRAAEQAARDAALRRWERLRANGRSAFVWRNGVVGWGLPAAVVTAAYKVIQE